MNWNHERSSFVLRLYSFTQIQESREERRTCQAINRSIDRQIQQERNSSKCKIMGKIEEKLESMGIAIPEAIAPKGMYVFRNASIY